MDWIGGSRFGAEIRAAIPIFEIDQGLFPQLDQIRICGRIKADPGIFLNQLFDKLDLPGSLSINDGMKNAVDASSRLPANSGIRELTEVDACSILQSYLPAKSFVVLDGSIVLNAGQQSIPRSNPFTILDPGWNGCMGTGLPFALGAKIESGSDPVILCTGDFAFGFNMIELEVCTRHQLPLFIFLFDNGGPIGQPHQFKAHSSFKPIHAYPSDLAYHQIADALGMRSFLAADASSLHEACRSVFDNVTAAFVHITIAPASCKHPSDLVRAR